MKSLAGKVAVVLGASARAGTGWAIAAALAEAGAKVVVGARSAGPLHELAQEIGGVAQVCDAAVEEQVAALANAAVESYGQLDIAVNAAGLPVLGMIGDCTQTQLQSALDVNYLGQVYFVKHMAAAMREGGAITLITSLSTTHPILPNFAYACAKAATDCLVKYAAIEYGARGIRINTIQPAGIVSDLTRDLFKVPAVREVFEKEIPLGRLGVPADFADAVLWLSGNAYVTGANLPVCGGNQLTRFPAMRELPGAEQTWEGQGVTLYDQQQAADQNKK